MKAHEQYTEKVLNGYSQKYRNNDVSPKLIFFAFQKTYDYHGKQKAEVKTAGRAE